MLHDSETQPCALAEAAAGGEESRREEQRGEGASGAPADARSSACLKAMLIEGRNAELVCAAGLVVAEGGKRRSDMDASAVAQDRDPAFNDN